MSGERRAGFTLLEIAVSLAILGIGMVACMQVFGGSLRLQDRALRETRAVLYARGLMDSVVARRTLQSSTEERPISAEGFKAKISVREADASDGIDPAMLEDENDIGWTLWTVAVEVAWQDGAGFKTYGLQTMQAKLDE